MFNEDAQFPTVNVGGRRRVAHASGHGMLSNSEDLSQRLSALLYQNGDVTPDEKAVAGSV